LGRRGAGEGEKQTGQNKIDQPPSLEEANQESRKIEIRNHVFSMNTTFWLD
jgi:hypothetical protein